MNPNKEKEERKRKRKMKVRKVHTVGSSELSDSVDEALVELDCPAETGLGVGGEDETGISLDTHWPVMGRCHRGGFLGGMKHCQLFFVLA